MNIPQEERALRTLSPQKYTIRILVIAVCFLVGGYPPMYAILSNKIDERDQQIKQCMVEKQQMSEQRRVEEIQKADERLREEKERSRKSDSMYYAITAAKIAVKKASKK